MSADDIVLESPPDADASGAPRRARLFYAHPLAHYCAPLDASERTLKLWLKLGREATPPDLPPFDEPHKMAAWYARHRKNRVPDHLVALAAQGPKVLAMPAPAPAGPLFAEPAAACGHVTTPSSPSSAAPVARAATGYSATLERLRAAEAAAGKKYTDLILEEGKDAEAEQARRIWDSITKQLRAYEKDAQEVLAAQGKIWPADEVTAVLYELHTVILQSFEALYGRIETELRTLPRDEAKRLYLAECQRLRAALVANKFTAPPAPTLAAA